MCSSRHPDVGLLCISCGGGQFSVVSVPGLVVLTFFAFVV